MLAAEVDGTEVAAAEVPAPDVPVPEVLAGVPDVGAAEVGVVAGTLELPDSVAPVADSLALVGVTTAGTSSVADGGTV